MRDPDAAGFPQKGNDCTKEHGLRASTGLIRRGDVRFVLSRPEESSILKLTDQERPMALEPLLHALRQSSERVLSAAQRHANGWRRQAPEGQWNPSEIFEHILIVERMVVDQLRARNATLDPDGVPYGVENLKATLLDRSHPQKTPPQFQPKGLYATESRFAADFVAGRDGLFRDLESGSLKIEDRRFHVHPVLGRISELEWLYFAIYHADRHLEQARLADPVQA